ncbi:MAG TPA: hypothetical protein VE360_05440, partial [Pyrinomonadaceae bacterium]|nr:hypothetical protein [Pyrinomonadaceae bacterium]
SMNSRLNSMDTRLRTLEEQSERRAMDTKPIWERALAEILAIQQRLDKVEEALKDLSRKIEVHSIDMVQMRANMRDHASRLDRLESGPTR